MSGGKVLVLTDYGPFREARLELAGLAVVIGRNSTGKSLLAYTYAALSRALNPVNLLLHAGEAPRQGLEEAARQYLEKALRGFTGRSPRDLVHLGEERAVAELETAWARITAVLSRDRGVEKVELEYRGKMGDLVEVVARLYERGQSSRRIHEAMAALAAEAGLPELLEAYLSPVVLVDSRSGIVKMVSKLQPYASLAALQQADLDLELALLLPSLASALEHGRVDLEAARPLLEELGVEEVKPTGRDITVKLAAGPLHALATAPSGVREALPLVLALAAKTFGDMVVEEPEAHLHPAAVKALARVLARAVNQGKSILITTHSDLLLSAVNNLVMLHARPGKAEKLGYTKKDLIDPGSVAAYATRARKGHVELERLHVDETGIPEDEFAQVVHGIADERAEALS